VVDRNTGESLIGANVVIEGTSVGAATDENGLYIIPNAPAGSYTLVASYVGYAAQSKEVQVADGETMEVDFEIVWVGIEGEDIVITAQALGQTRAINQQLRSNTITNVVSAASIQELPDVNAAESVGRLPGVSIKRSGGEASKVAIRGLSPKYNTVTVNGVRIPSTSGDDRSVDLSLISSNALDGIEVMKAITPDRDADAIGGSIDLKLRDAPDETMVDLLAQVGYNQLRDDFGNYKLVGTVGQRFFNNKLGVIATANLDEFNRSADQFNGDYRQSTIAGTDESSIIISGVTVNENALTRGRAGASLVLDYKIAGGKIMGNGFYNRRTFDQLRRSNVMLPDANRLRYETTMGDGSTSIFTGTLGIEQNLRRFAYDVSVSRTASRSDNRSDFWQFNQEANGFTTAPDENTLPSEIPETRNVDSLATGLQDVFVFDTNLKEDEWAAQANLQIPFFFSNTVSGYFKTGGRLRWLDRANDQEQNGRNGIYYGSGAGLNPPLRCTADALPDLNLEEIVLQLGLLPVELVARDDDRDDFLEGDYPIGFIIDTDEMQRISQAMQDCGPDIWRNYSIGSLGRDYQGSESYQAAYAMAEFNIGPRLTLIPGVRWEGDQSTYTGQRYRETQPNNVQGPPAELETLTNERDNSFWLPMAHLRYQPTNWLQLRLAYTETLTRPDYIQYAPITTINFFRTYVRAANGLLRPAQSTNLDAALAVHHSHVGFFSVAAFRKRIDDLIIFVDYNLHPDVGTLPGMNVPDHWVEVRPRASTFVNNPFEATYRGIEFDWQTNFWYLPSLLKGLVLNINYTLIDSDTEYQAYFIVNSDSLIRRRPPVYLKELRTDSTRVGRLPDQPAHVANVTLGYDIKGFSARFSVLFQTNTSTFINSTNPLFDTISGDFTRLDLFVRQKLGRGLELFANFNNLNGRPDEVFRGAVDTNPSFTEFYGRTFDVGIRYRN
jgi:TonB-dependent receptor